jgi:hypothetical protein
MVTFLHKKECFGMFPNDVQFRDKELQDDRLVDGQVLPTNIAVILLVVQPPIISPPAHISQHKFKHQHRQLPSASNCSSLYPYTRAIKT